MCRALNSLLTHQWALNHAGFIDDTPRDKYGNPITEAEMEDEDEEEDEGGEDKQAEDEVDQAEGSEDAKY